MDAQKANYEVTRMARLLRVTRQGYYAWRKQRQTGPGPRARRRAEIDQAMREAFRASDEVYGARGSLASSLIRAWSSTARRSPPRCVGRALKASARAGSPQ